MSDQKCKYPEINAKCEYCEIRGLVDCIKIWGPKQQTALSGTMPSAASANIGPQSGPILQWFHSDKVLDVALPHSDGKCNAVIIKAAQWNILNFIKTVLHIYSPSINSRSLRGALFVFGGIVTSGGSFATREAQNLQHALAALRYSVSSGKVEEPDLFASFLLAFVSWARPDQQPEEYKVHLKGFINILYHISRSTTQPFYLKQFWPMARDLLLSVPFFRMPGCTDSSWFDLYDGCCQVLGPPTLAQCQEYRNDKWAVYDHLHYHQRILARAFMARISPREHECARSIEAALKNIAADLQSVENYLLNRSDMEHDVTDSGLGALMEFRICKLYLTILEEPNHNENLNYRLRKVASLDAALELIQVLSLVADFNQQTKGSWGLSFSDVCDQMSMWALSLAALTLSDELLCILFLHNSKFPPSLL